MRARHRLFMTQMRPLGATATLRGAVPTAISASFALVDGVEDADGVVVLVHDPHARVAAVRVS